MGIYFISIGGNLYNNVSYKIYLRRIYIIYLQWLFCEKATDLIT